MITGITLIITVEFKYYMYEGNTLKPLYLIFCCFEEISYYFLLPCSKNFYIKIADQKFS